MVLDLVSIVEIVMKASILDGVGRRERKQGGEGKDRAGGSLSSTSTFGSAKARARVWGGRRVIERSLFRNGAMTEARSGHHGRVRVGHGVVEAR